MKKSKAIVILIVILGALAGLAYYASIILSSTGIGEEIAFRLVWIYPAVFPLPIRLWMTIQVRRI